jgi:fluoride ion exporter CrcB/FEX
MTLSEAFSRSASGLPLGAIQRWVLGIALETPYSPTLPLGTLVAKF